MIPFLLRMSVFFAGLLFLATCTDPYDPFDPDDRFTGINDMDQLLLDEVALEFCPGTGFMYSTRGYGVLGEVLTEIAGRSYSALIDEYIEAPVGAQHFYALARTLIHLVDPPLN